jgi:hypothetical protein
LIATAGLTGRSLGTPGDFVFFSRILNEVTMSRVTASRLEDSSLAETAGGNDAKAEDT